MKQTTLIATSVLAILCLFFVGCVEQPLPTTPQTVTQTTTTQAQPVGTTQELKTFSSAQEIKDFLDSQRSTQGSVGFESFGRMAFADVGIADFAVEESAAVKSIAAAPSAGGSASEFSQTNIQVKGVDEADFVKNDGKYIYVVSGQKLVIVDAFPADDAEIISETKIDGQPQQLFINDDRLVVFATGNREVMKISPYDFVPYPRYTSVTHIFVYDISDKEDPELIKDYTINGWYSQSRMIDDVVYVIAKESVYYYNNIIDLPVLREADAVIVQPEIQYFDNPEDNYVFHSVMALNIKDESDVEMQSFMMGHSNTIYMSTNNLYITYQKNLPYHWYRQHNVERFYEVILPLLPEETQEEAKKVRRSQGAAEEIALVLENMYNNMEEKERQKLIEEIQDAINEYELKQQVDRAKTVIHRIAVDGTDIDYQSRGEVPGYLLNQFSLDEYDDNLRVATTLNLWTRNENILYNNVYVLNEDMETIGQLEDIAPDERIYSTRFIGDRLYMVTFKRIDPFFVIDLSNPQQPSILGELKIPGFSDYLHPYDENHIIGVGKETESNQWGGVSTKGVKLALFDVSDVNNPEEIAKIEIGKSGTDSEALREHKAFLFDKEKNILVLPIREVTDRYKDERYGYYRNRVWQGAYVLGLTPEDGFSIKGTVTHEKDGDDSYYWNSPYAVKRSLYMDDVLYTVSREKILANDLKALDVQYADIDLPTERNDRYPRYPLPTPLIEVIEDVGIAIE